MFKHVLEADEFCNKKITNTFPLNQLLLSYVNFLHKQFFKLECMSFIAFSYNF